MTAALLHGFAGTPAAWNDVVTALPWPAHAVALPGHGRPIAATWHANLAAVADALAGCDLVVGYSLGARVALGLVATGRIARAILIGVHPGLPEAERPARRARDAGWAELLRRRGMAAFCDAWQAQPLFASQAHVAPDRLAGRRAARLALDPEPLARSLEVMGLAEMPDYRAAIAGRVHLVVGEDDARFRTIAEQLPAPLDVIAGSGHDPTLEQPEALAALIARLM